MPIRTSISAMLVGAVMLTAGAAALAVDADRKSPPTPESPVLAILSQFAAPDVPARGPAEGVPTTRKWNAATVAATLPADLPGKGIAQHPMLYAGEGYNTVFIISDGKVIWTYNTGGGTGEISDAWVMSNGHVLIAAQHHVEEITPRKEIVWKYEVPTGCEVHSLQPIGLDKVLLVQNGLPPKLKLIVKATGAVEYEHDLPAISTTDPKTVHPQFRRVRMTAAGTFILPFLKMDQVTEYDRDFKEVWTHKITNPWSAVRLHNGNTLITDEKDRLTREVNAKGETVWEFTRDDLPGYLTYRNTQTSCRLASGNTVICSGSTGKFQAIEVTPDKKVVWVLADWENLGPATTIQFLDEPGVPERPGDLQR